MDSTQNKLYQISYSYQDSRDWPDSGKKIYLVVGSNPHEAEAKAWEEFETSRANPGYEVKRENIGRKIREIKTVSDLIENKLIDFPKLSLPMDQRFSLVVSFSEVGDRLEVILKEK